MTEPWREALAAESGGAAEIPELFGAILATEGCSPALAGRLARLARDGGAAWSARRLAVSMLELHLIRAAPVSPEQRASCAAMLGVGEAELPDLLRRLARLARVHDRLRGSDVTAEAIGDLLHVARSERRLALARCFFTPEEVVARVASLTRTSAGADRPFPPQHAIAPGEADRAVGRLPPYEARVAALLRASPRVHWVSEAPSDALHALVEYPQTTVALVVRPPGSEVELELKRAGRPARRPFTVVHRRGGQEVPASHRLDGAGMMEDFHDEGGAGAVLAAVHRLVHGEEAPISRVLAVRSIETLPAGDTEVPVAEYLDGSDADLEGALAAYLEEDETEGWASPPMPEGLGLAERFVLYAVPSQAILVGTSSFRLDRTADYLAPRGLEIRFPGRAPGRDEARRFADDVLEQALGVLTAPSGAYVDHGAHVEAAFEVPENRARADLAHGAAMEDFGRMWGTILGLGGCSHGESLVARNVGIRTVWTGRTFAARLTFMDHDNLHLLGSPRGALRPEALRTGAAKDRLALFGGQYKGQRIRGSVELCEAIYRVPAPAIAAGRAALRASARRAFEQTQRALREDPRLHALVSPPFEVPPGWDETVAALLGETEAGAWGLPS